MAHVDTDPDDATSHRVAGRGRCHIREGVLDIWAGIIKTPMNPIETHAKLGPLHSLGRMGEISDIVDAILYLESASFVTGEILNVDGGQRAGH